MAVEDFSFQVPARIIDSPRMWRPTEEETATRQDHGDLETTTITTKKRVVDLGQRSFSCIETSKRDEFIMSGFDKDGDKGEKMDLLWESFNEELPRSQSSRVADSDVDHRSGDRDQRVEVGCVKAMKLSKTRSSGSNNHHQSAVVLVLRILKRLFTIHHHHKHHHHHHHHQHLHHQSKLKAAHAW